MWARGRAASGRGGGRVGEWGQGRRASDGAWRGEGRRRFVNGRAGEVHVVRDCLTRTIVGGSEGHLTLGERFRDRGLAGGLVDELVVVARALAAVEVARLYDGDQPVDASPAPALQLSPQQREALRSARQQRDELRDRVRQIMTMEDTAEERVVRRLERGRYELPREVVTRGVPRAIGPELSSAAPVNRLTLARWLTNPKHPLTARVAVNRLWQGLFGRGIVATPEDAWRCFMGTEIEILVVENCFLIKEEQDPALKLDYKDAFELD